MSHTPGPWTLKRDDASKFDMGGIRSGFDAVCAFGWDHYNEPKSGWPPDEDDLALILAAPDLLAALKAILTIGCGRSDGEGERECRYCGCLDDDLNEPAAHEPDCAWVLARAAAAKAEAQTS